LSPFPSGYKRRMENHERQTQFFVRRLSGSSLL
jgi:hypothetical protein